MVNICIIPARGGSKRISKKNIKDFLGKPIIAYSIEAAIKSNLFDEIMVSTDDNEIAEIAKSYGAKVPFMRSSNNSDDFATTFDVIEEVATAYENTGIIFDNLCCLYSCAPFVSKETLSLGLKLLVENKFDTVFPIIPYSFPIQKALSKSKHKISMIHKEHLKTRSQDLEERFHDAGQFYWCNTKALLTSKKMITSNTGGFVISEMEAQDIDTETDWKLAELKYQLLI